MFILLCPQALFLYQAPMWLCHGKRLTQLIFNLSLIWPHTVQVYGVYETPPKAGGDTVRLWLTMDCVGEREVSARVKPLSPPLSLSLSACWPSAMNVVFRWRVKMKGLLLELLVWCMWDLMRHVGENVSCVAFYGTSIELPVAWLEKDTLLGEMSW